jgi:hypothetical protein
MGTKSDPASPSKYFDIPKNFRPEITLQIDSVKDTNWAKTNKEDIALVILPTLAPLPFGVDIKSIALDDDFIKEMKMLSFKHGFWAKMMVNGHDQYATDFDTGMHHRTGKGWYLT